MNSYIKLYQNYCQKGLYRLTRFVSVHGTPSLCSLRSTSGVTLADLLAVSVLPVLSPHTVAEVRLLGLVLSEYL